MKTMRKYLCLLLVLCFSSAALAGGGNFWNTVSTNWWDDDNWTGGAPPVTGENGWICADAVVGSGTAAFDWAYVGWVENGSVTIDAGASFNVYTSRIGNVGGGGLKNGSMTVEGYYSAWGDTIIGEFANGSMIINGNGVVNNAAVVTYMGANDGSTGYLELNDTASMTTAWLNMEGTYWPGDPLWTKVQLNGGTLATGGVSMIGTPNATIDFDGGTLVMGGEVDVEWLEANGYFTSTEGLDFTYDGELNQTTVFEVPEPATLALLSLGGMLLFRKRRA